MISKQYVAIGATAGLVLTAGIFLYVQHQQSVQHEKEIHQIGVEWQQLGWLSEGDYVKFRTLGAEAVAKHQLSDGDINWLLNQLQESKVSTVHLKVMGILCALSNPPEAQKVKIASALAPMMQGTDNSEKTSAEKVQRLLKLTI